jgi:hypothetical protein
MALLRLRLQLRSPELSSWRWFVGLENQKAPDSRKNLTPDTQIPELRTPPASIISR